MDTEILFSYVQSYGYVIIFLFLFFGVVGIPAPEESLLFFLGIFIAKQQLLWEYCFIASWGGVVAGMVIAYGIGRFLGAPFIKRYGKYIGIKEEKWERTRKLFHRQGKWVILFGYYVPGVRQISPYMAGVIRFPFRSFLLLASVGAAIWTIPIIVAGMLLGRHVQIPLIYFPMFGIAAFLLFLLGMWVAQRFRKKSLEN
ncbi:MULTISPECIES: DedA family protein [Parageobacillus]|uniref:Alkaline phosphatase n=1 Tax=Parageobacillus thermoglucosidasius TaxID=1426 RepID=A0A1B7KNH7_PARTM|nr:MULTISPECIES: DedA family protein [Parageobacillus]OAT71622.1 alkaline phosphatase [Parageobacillus thermoglucosidasius]BDG49040.1 DedA family protein [Parageobacillus sp. KH3-4]